ncbi:hypothetical protein LTR48_002819 [Friedmanniomyces endolithicus]|uniref:Uncharacterized protein n=1 Tax=Rachicladosporium monterosium TaxID=1507873 RepID=A0ABR0LA16_9PEZI|nr:hypothetical protein LTR29_011875 [Friedmanniomyces endolithicus]KAK1087221.1 hypothetical protein LTR48_002819 [Friedmanniomyces endolithicus]KAK5145779.1 hypothetical protein LTR32_002525 [Rachicladosporium monterosium]
MSRLIAPDVTPTEQVDTAGSRRLPRDEADQTATRSVRRIPLCQLCKQHWRIIRMETHLRPDTEGPRLLDSPRRSPVTTHAVSSPVRSVYPEMQGLDSIHDQPDFGLRTADFFEYTSEDDSAILPEPGSETQNVEPLQRSRKGRKGRQSLIDGRPLAPNGEPKRVSPPPDEGYQRLVGLPGLEEKSRFTDTPGTSFHGSVDELLPAEERSSPPQFLRPAHIPSGRTPRSSAQLERPDTHQTPVSSKVDQILGAHAIAHEITLQSLMRDEEALDRSLQSFAPLNSEYRASMLPPSLRFHDPRSPRNPTFATPQSVSSKKVHVVPPPIDTSAPRRSLPADLVRTPYPSTPDKVHRKDFGHDTPSTLETSPSLAVESELTLGIRRANLHSLPRVTSLTIPASNEFSAIRSLSITTKERHFKALDFDDEELFRQLRLRYRRLSGPMLFLSARSLRRIVVSGPASKAADAGYGWLHQPRSPQVLAYRGLSDTFSEEKILQHYRKPALGRQRYAFVHWAHRLAAAPPVRTPQGDDDVRQTVEVDLVRRMEQPEGLEFVVSWSIARIMLVIAVILALSIGAALLWVFLGRNTVFGGLPHGGFHDAGDRVGSGVLIGICIILIGLTSMAGWLGVSWLVM